MRFYSIQRIFLLIEFHQNVQLMAKWKCKMIEVEMKGVANCKIEFSCKLIWPGKDSTECTSIDERMEWKENFKPGMDTKKSK